MLQKPKDSSNGEYCLNIQNSFTLAVSVTN